jgi:hypothetical protein
VSRALGKLLDASFVEFTRGSDRREHIYRLSIAGYAELARHNDLAESPATAREAPDDERIMAGILARPRTANSSKSPDWLLVNRTISEANILTVHS